MSNKQILIDMGVDNGLIESSPTLLRLLENYAGSINIGAPGEGTYTKFEKIKVDGEEKILRSIYIDPTMSNIISLAHELGHATGDFQSHNIETSESAEDYAKKVCKAEGEAIYYSYAVWSELNKAEPILFNNPSNYFSKVVWEEDEQASVKKDFSSIYAEKTAFGLVPPNETLFDALGEQVAIMVPSGTEGNAAAAGILTYDEQARWDYLTAKKGLGDVLKDFEEAMQRDLNADPMSIKSLVNKSHKFYSENGSDALINKHDKGENSKSPDLLYGGKGNDTIHGNSGLDILIGGDDDDELYGEGGNDTLAGNQGHDTLDGGSDYDLYIADKDDIIRDDEKGEGVVYLDDKLLSVAYKEGDVEGVYKDKQGNVYKQVGNDLIINDGLKIENFFLSLNGKKIPDGYKYLSITLKEKSKEEESNENGAPSFDKAENIRPPIVLDLNNNGIETKKYGEGAYFDHDGNGLRESTAWVAGGDGLLVRDLNNNGKIDDGSELFGNYTNLSNGNKANNGFEALAELDQNKDGIINKNDSAYDSLLVWQDLNGNGTTEQGELKKLSELGIASINTTYTTTNKTDANGNKYLQQGSITFENGTKANATDVWFQIDTTRRIESNHIEISDYILALPNAKGFGNVHDLHEAMMLDPELKKLVEAVLAETDTTKRSDLLDAMIYRWTGVENVDPNSRDSNSGYGHVMDARQLEALEALVGRGYLGTWCIGSRDPNPHGQASSELIAEYRKFKNYTEAQLLVQSDYTLIGDVMDSLFSGSGRESFIVNWEALNTKLTGLMAQGETAKVLEIITLLDHLGIYTSSYQDQKQQIIQSGSEFGNLLKELHGSPNLYQVTQASWGTTLDMKGTTAQGRIDIIRFDDSVLAQDIQVTRKKQSLILTYKKTGQTIELSNYFSYQGDTTGKATSEIQFIQGGEIETWYLEQIKVMALQDTGGDDVILGYEVDNKIDGGLGNDKIEGGNKNDLLMGGVGNDTIDGKNGDDTIMGGDGDDRLYGSWGNKLFIGGAGNDYLAGGNGFNTYQFSRGWGSDSITAGNYSKYGKDIISFTDDIKPSDIIARRSNDSIILKLKETDDQIFIYGYFGRDIYTIQFADGSSWDRNKIEELVLLPSDGNDSIRGTASNELLYGGAGQDTLYGQEGNDTLYGEDGNDKLYGEEGDDILYGGLGGDSLYGGLGEDTLSGDAGNDNLSGDAGNDILIGAEGDDTLVGGEGDDILDGGNGNDTLDGGAGNDYLGGYGKTTYRFATGWGEDTITLNSSGDEAVIEFDQGISSENIIISNEKYNLVIKYKNGNDVIYVLGTRYATNSTVTLKFADGTLLDWATIKALALQGTAGDDIIYGFYQDDIITGSLGNDTIYGDQGNDTLYGDEGNDSLVGGFGDNLLYGGEGDDSLLAAGGNSTLIGGEGNDYLESSSDNTSFIFDRGWGNDTLSTLNESNTLDTIFFGEGIKPEDILLAESYADSNLLISLKGSTDTILVKSFFRNSSIEQAGIGAIYFADGTQWDFDYIKSHIGLKIDNWYGSGKELKGNDGNDTITGGKYDDTLIGGGGNDLLTGGAGNDTYFFDKNWGQDTIKNNSWDDSYIYGTNTQAIDVIKFGEGILSQDIMVSQGEDGVTLTIKGSNDSLYIPGLDLYNGALHYNIDQIQFADGTVWDREKLKQQAMLGTEGDDIIYGTDQNDTITAGKGNDSLNSSTGSDTYQFGLSLGQDTLSQWYMNDNEPLAGSDTIKLIDGITSQDITLTYQGQDLIIKFNQSPNDQITVQNYFTSYNKVNGILFSDGTFWGQQDITNHLPNGSLVIPNEWGDMVGGIGNDTLISGEGYNSLDGGDGSDTYIFNQNWGDDYISQSSNTKGLSATDSDTIYFSEGISEQDITIQRDAYGLTLYDKNNPENKIYVNGYFDKGLNQINQIQFADGTIWSKELIDQKVNQGLQILGTEDDDEYLMGGFGSDTIMGNAGNDYLQGENYYELFAEGIRKDYLDGGIGNDTLIAIGDQNTLLGGLGDDQLNSSGSFNTLEGNEGDDYIDSKGSYNTIDAGGGNNTISSQGSHNKIMGGNDTDNINVSTEYDHNGNSLGGHDTIFGLGGYDFISIDTDMNYIDGGDGNDYIYTNGNHNTLIGGLGDDQLEGGYNTTYQFDSNWGNDTINNWSDISLNAEGRIEFIQNINKENLIFTQDNQNLLISYGNNSIKVSYYFDSDESKVNLYFNDGTVWQADEIQQRLNGTRMLEFSKFTINDSTENLANIENQTNNFISAISSFAAESANETINVDQTNYTDQLLIAVNQ